MPDAPIIAPLLFTSDQAAAALQISPRTLWSLTEPRGPIPVVRLGHLVRYDPRDLTAFIDRQRQTADTTPRARAAAP